jgi:hypothetical protein
MQALQHWCLKTTFQKGREDEFQFRGAILQLSIFQFHCSKADWRLTLVHFDKVIAITRA